MVVRNQLANPRTAKRRTVHVLPGYVVICVSAWEVSNYGQKNLLEDGHRNEAVCAVEALAQ